MVTVAFRPLPLVALLFPTVAAAAGVEVTVDAAGGSDLANQLGIELNEIGDQLEAELTKSFNVATPGEYIRALADAQAFSNRGLGVDYGSNPTKIIFGAAGNFALSLGDEGLGERYQDRPVVGAAPNVALMLGFTWSFLDWDDLTTYVNWFEHRTEVKQIGVGMRNFGIHGQWKFFRPEGDAMELLFQWGGLDFTTGAEWSRLTLELKDELSTVFPLAGESQSVDATFLGTGTYDLTANAFTVPFEITTNFRVLYVLTLFVGAGFDLQLGGGASEIDLEGSLTAKNPAGGGDISLGTAHVEVKEEADPTPGKLRFLGGVQLNLWMVKVLIQLNVIPDRTFSAGAGLRVAW